MITHNQQLAIFLNWHLELDKENYTVKTNKLGWYDGMGMFVCKENDEFPFKPDENWNDWRKLEEALMKNEELWFFFIRHWATPLEYIKSGPYIRCRIAELIINDR